NCQFAYKWIKHIDIHFRRQNRHICMLLDNFPGHKIDYEPTNIHLEPLHANLTSHVQPLDAGIIRCVKAHYWKAFCLRAIELDEAGADNIYPGGLLEAIFMVQVACYSVSAGL